MMLTINLLPQEGPGKSAASLKSLHRLPLVWLVGGLAAVWIVLLLGVTQFRQFRLSQLKSELQRLEPQKAQVQRLQQTVTRLRNEESSFKGLGAGTIYLSQRLQVLAEAVPNTVWYKELVLDPRGGMVLRGAAIAQNGIEMAHIGKLVQALSRTGGFVEDFGAIRIDSIKRASQEGVEVVDFVLMSGKDAAQGGQ